MPKIAGEGDSAWLLLQAQVTEEGQPSFLSGYGEPLHAIPFRVSFGDVVLFDDSGLMAHVVSGVTGGKYDHIGIVVRQFEFVAWLLFSRVVLTDFQVPVPPHDKRSLMEASRKGCFAYPIENRMKETLENKARVGLRRLKREGGASEKIRETLRNFVVQGFFDVAVLCFDANMLGCTRRERVRVRDDCCEESISGKQPRQC